ncbi:MAG: nucleotidyl transferase AbiEii/AbiGii toxin family protein [Planctomycetes bacterium]|nr:nucleotidyl transferase AbiEii/AbiGii toxin family protein [Planctomycetota bacterium]
MTEKPSNVSASVRARLQRVARDRREDFQLVLIRYANERLLYRLANSSHASRFVLKGAALFLVWTGRSHRVTRELDFLGHGEPSVERLRQVFTEVLTLDTPDDGVQFDLDTLEVGLIREDQVYGGVRIVVVAHIAAARVRVQVDVGFGDAITPAAVLVEFPGLLSFPAPRLHAYPRETVVAEKFEAMVQLGVANSRMKDFHDIAVLARGFDFEGELLTRAIRATFERRRTALPSSTPTAWTPAFANDATKQAQWAGFVRKASVEDAGSLARTIEEVRAFLDAPLRAAAGSDTTPGTWRAGGPWS